MKLFLISLFSVIVVAMGLLTTRFWGLGQSYQAFEHPFFASSQKPIIGWVLDNPPETLQAENPQLPEVIWLNVHTTKDQKLVVLENEDFAKILTQENLKENWFGNKIPNYDLDQIQKIFPTSHKLDDYLQKWNQQKFILNINDNVPDLHLIVTKSLESFNCDKRVLIQSDTAVILSSIKEIKPMWVYGSSYPDLMKLLSMDSLWVLPAASFKGDALVTPLKIVQRPAFNADIIREMKRRFKKVVLGPLVNKSEINEALEYQPDMIIVNEKSLL